VWWLVERRVSGLLTFETRKGATNLLIELQNRSHPSPSDNPKSVRFLGW
jgi:hypothetical protein